MKTSEVIAAWGKILKGEQPSLSIELTRECPLRCPGCYAYDDAHLGGGVTLRGLTDRTGQALIDGVLECVDRLKPLHLSLVGGDPLVRYRELEATGAATDRTRNPCADRHQRLSYSAGSVGLNDHLNVVVSIDGLQPEHDVRRAPATYDRIIRHIAGQKITIHCTVTGQMMASPGYLRRFLEFWTPREEIQKVWFSLFTPQIGDEMDEILKPAQRARPLRICCCSAESFQNWICRRV